MIVSKYFELNNQNIILKLLLVLIMIIATSLLDGISLYLIFFFFILFVALKPSLLLSWLDLSLKFSFLFVSLFILGMLFDIPFPSSMQISLKIWLLLLVSVYLFKSVSVRVLLASTGRIRSPLLQDVSYFLAATLSFIPLFIESYHLNRKIYAKDPAALISESLISVRKKYRSITVDLDVTREDDMLRSLGSADIPVIILILIIVFWIIYHEKILP